MPSPEKRQSRRGSSHPVRARDAGHKPMSDNAEEPDPMTTPGREAIEEALVPRFADMLDEWERTKRMSGIRERARRLARVAARVALDEQPRGPMPEPTAKELRDSFLAEDEPGKQRITWDEGVRWGARWMWNRLRGLAAERSQEDREVPTLELRDLQIDTYRSSDGLPITVRVTHRPTSKVAIATDQSGPRARERALSVLRGALSAEQPREERDEYGIREEEAEGNYAQGYDDGKTDAEMARREQPREADQPHYSESLRNILLNFDGNYEEVERQIKTLVAEHLERLVGQARGEEQR